ncbi:host attachment protein [Tabrizicola sp.]|uniref:host attachment protein n=1 Tax=Tabrizicola sp. TaxID=2005166 RepID=UPI00286A8ABC|nr:host attachment protein [Tabrizicola sp.]
MKDVVWALVMSSTQARIIKGIAKGATDEMPELALHAEHKDLREIMADKPGRSFASVGSARSAMEYASDPVKDAKRAFVDEAVILLHQHFVKHDFTHLAIFAGPEMLGLLRDGLPPDLQHAIIVDMPKNLLHETPHDLRRIVTDHVFTKG